MAMTFHNEFDGYPLKSARFSTYDSRGGVNVVKVGAGFLHAITFTQLDAAPTAGAIAIYDMNNVSVYGTAGSVLLLHTQTTGIFMPVTVILDIPFTTGLAVGIATPMTDVGVQVSYK